MLHNFLKDENQLLSLLAWGSGQGRGGTGLSREEGGVRGGVKKIIVQ